MHFNNCIVCLTKIHVSQLNRKTKTESVSLKYKRLPQINSNLFKLYIFAQQKCNLIQPTCSEKVLQNNMDCCLRKPCDGKD